MYEKIMGLLASVKRIVNFKIVILKSMHRWHTHTPRKWLWITHFFIPKYSPNVCKRLRSVSSFLIVAKVSFIWYREFSKSKTVAARILQGPTIILTILRKINEVTHPSNACVIQQAEYPYGVLQSNGYLYEKNSSEWLI